ncbi:HEAT repeat domain-containing protein, partial [Hansschlegelia beijingensis]
MPPFDPFGDDLADLKERATDPDPGIRRVAMMELAEEVGPDAKVLLLSGLADPDPEVRAAAAKALDEHDGPDVVEGLVGSLEDPDAAVRQNAAEALAAFARAASADVVHLHSGAYALASYDAPVIVSCHSCLATWWAAMHGGEPPADFQWRTAATAHGYVAADRLVAPTAAFAA